MSQSFKNVSVDAKANIYFDGKVVSHTLITSTGAKKTLGLIYPGAYQFNTGKPEIMEITSGACRVRVAGDTTFKAYVAPSQFEVKGDSSFEIAVDEGIAEYICSFVE